MSEEEVTKDDAVGFSGWVAALGVYVSLGILGYFLIQLYNYETSHFFSIRFWGDRIGLLLIFVTGIILFWVKMAWFPPSIAANNIQDEAGNTPLMIAILGNQIEETKKYLYFGTNLDLRNSAGESALTLGLQSKLPPDLILDILGKTKHTNQRTLALQTPLQLALESGHPSTVIKKLIKKGAKTDFVTKTGETALILAAKYSEESEIIGILLKEGVNPNHADQAKRTAIEYAKENEKINGTSEFWLLHDVSSS
jgi:hypothetical protein